MFTHLSDFQGNEAQFAAWVFRIARNDLIDEARRRGRRPVETDLDPTGAETVPGGDTEVEALDRLGDDWVVDQLAALTPEQRDVVALRIVGDLRVEDVADVMDKRVGAIKALQRRAFRALARNLESGAYPDARSGRSNG